MAELIGKFKLMKTCKVTKHSAVGHKSRRIFLRIGVKNMSSMSNTGAVLLPKMIHSLESLASGFKNSIFKMTSDTLGKGQNKLSVATILNAENISDD